MRTVLFLDIDGVFSIPNTENIEERKERWDGCGVLWPIPMAMALIRAIDRERDIHPVWLSAWDKASTTWNARAYTRAWDVAYHLTKRQEPYAKLYFPDFHERMDRKLLAVRYYLLKRHYGKRIVWLEDGFAEETKQWAEDTLLVKLVDTTEPDIRVFLLEDHAYHDLAVQEFIKRWL